MEKKKTGISPPILYPRDSDVKDLKVKPQDLTAYLRVQRVHQNNVEYLVVVFPLLLIAGVYSPIQAAIAGAVIIVGRQVFALGYYSATERRSFGAFHYFGALYLVFLCGSFAYKLLTKSI